MKSRVLLSLSLSAALGVLSGCQESKESAAAPSVPKNNSGENIDAEERAIAAKLKPARDPIQDEIEAFRDKVRQTYENRRYDELEKQVAELRAGKETFRNGSWKLSHFYTAFTDGKDDSDRRWQSREQNCKDWIAAFPKSVTARVIYGDLLTVYAWRARGAGYANTVTEEGGRLFVQRLNAARRVIGEARDLPEKDAYCWLVALRIARGQGWPKAAYDELVKEARAFEPKFWGYQTERAFSLLPRWYGEKGDWEAYAEQEAAHPNGLGAEGYARIVMMLRGYHENIFRETKASWPKTREGLAQLREKYPDALEFVSQTALLAAMVEDRDLAKAMFDRLGDTYLPGVWRKPERFAHVRNWALTGNW